MTEEYRLTPEKLEEVIEAEDYHVFLGTTVTVCCLTLKNGYNVIGQSACIDPAYFDGEVGRTVARENAVNKIWQLEGYMVKERMFNDTTQLTAGDVEGAAA